MKDVEPLRKFYPDGAMERAVERIIYGYGRGGILSI
jgi:hypothetical protein